MKLDRVIAVRTKKTIYRDGDRCVKVFNVPYSKSAIYNEAHNHVRVEETGIKVPSVLEVTTFDGKWAIVTEYIPGKTLEQLINEQPENKAEYYRILAELQNDIHKKECPYLYRLKDELNHKISISELDATTRFDLYDRLENMEKGMSVCHGDFCPSNVILSENGGYYVIDWTLASYGNPLADTAQTYILLCLNNGAEDAELYLDLYCGESKRTRESVYAWLPIIGAAMSVRRPLRERTVLLDCVKNGNFKERIKNFKN